MNILKYILFVVIGILLAAVGYLGYENISSNKEIVSLNKKIIDLKAAKVTTIIRKDSIVYKDTTIYKPYPVRDTIIDSIPYPVQGTITYYDNVYRRDRYSFRYKIKARGVLDELQFTDFVVPADTITNTLWDDTCYSKPPQYKPMNHWGLYGELIANNFKTFPGIGAGVQLSFKDRLTIGAGALYFNSGIYGNLRVGVLLK